VCVTLSIAVGERNGYCQAFTFTSGNLNYGENFDAMGSMQTLVPGWISNDSGILVSDGSLGAGSLYNVGTLSSSDRALGSICTFAVHYFGASFFNGATSTISSISFAGVTEQWRTSSSSTSNDTVQFSYSLNATSLTDSAATWTSLPSFNLHEILTTINSSFSVDGNASANRAAINSGAGNILVSWQANAPLWIRWSNSTVDGSLLAIDDFAMNAAIAKSLIWNPGSPNWDSTSANWLNGGASAVFTNGDSVIFTDAGLANGAAVNVDAAGVSPTALSIQNTSGTYTFSGGTISGFGSLDKSGAGTLALSVSCTRPINVTGGTLVLSAASTNSVTVTGATLRTGSDEVIAKTAAITLGEGAKLDLLSIPKQVHMC
jgi:hypothetical protein